MKEATLIEKEVTSIVADRDLFQIIRWGIQYTSIGLVEVLKRKIDENMTYNERVNCFV